MKSIIYLLSLGNSLVTTFDDGFSTINVYVGDDEKIHYTDWTGADSVLSFKSRSNVRTENLGNKTATTNNSASASTSYNISNITRSEIVSIYASAVFDSSHRGYVIVMRSDANTFGYKVQQAVSNFYVNTSVSEDTISISVTTGGTVYTGASLSINCIINVV